jgi:hypothetical protein
MSRLNAAWFNFTKRGQTWDHFWQDAVATAGGLSCSASLLQVVQVLSGAAKETFKGSGGLTHVTQTFSGSAKETLKGSASLSQIVMSWSGGAKETLKGSGVLTQPVQIFNAIALEKFLATASLNQILEVLSAEASMSGGGAAISWARRRRAFLSSRGRGI